MFGLSRRSARPGQQVPGQQVPGQQGQLSQAAAAAGVEEALARADHLSAAGPTSTGPTGGIPGLAGAFPLPNTAGLLAGTTEHSTTIITFLYFRPGTSFGQQTASANQYVRWYLNQPADHVIGVTGPIPAEYAQSQIIQDHLFWVELFTVLAIALILGLRFRSVGAPLAALACAGTAYVLAVRIVAWTAQRTGISLPPDLDPVLVVLLLGVTTDYSVFFLDGMRTRLAEGVPRVRAARLATAEFAPIIATAGLIVAAATASLAVARTDLLRAFGPGLALTVLTAMVVSMTLEPGSHGGLRRLAVPAGSAPAAPGRPGPAGPAGAVHGRAVRRDAAHGAADRGGLRCRPARRHLGGAGSAPRLAADPRASGLLDRRTGEHRCRRGLRAAPGASRSITTAGVALAASFAMLAVIPLEQFRQIAITMAAGVILDAIAVRSLLVPTLVALFGRLGMWPGNRRTPQVRVEPRVSAGAARTR